MGKIKLALMAGLLEPYHQRVKDVCDITYLGQRYGKPIAGQELLEAALSHDIVYVNAEPVTREMIKAWKESGMKLIGCGRGTPVNVDWKAVKEFDVPLVYTPGRNAESVAEYAFGLMLALIRRIAPNYHALQSGKYLGEEKEDIYDVPELRTDVVWRGPGSVSPMQLYSGGFDLYERTLGLIGFGAIGSRVARIAKGFGMTVKVYDPYCPKERIEEAGALVCDLNETLSTADVVSIHLPVNPGTRNIVNADWFDKMRPEAYFLNTARAAVVDQKALIEALEQKRIAGAAVDVMWEEPAPLNHPMLHMENVVITSHLAGMSADVDKWQSSMIADEILRFSRKEKPQLVWTRME